MLEVGVVVVSHIVGVGNPDPVVVEEDGRFPFETVCFLQAAECV